jgi:hypothetical protein
MTNIIKFPRQARAAVAEPMPKTQRLGVGAAVVQGVWVFVVLVWPLLKWIVAIDSVFHLARMIYHWNTPGVYAGWTFMLHFTVLTALTYFVSIYKPKGI